MGDIAQEFRNSIDWSVDDIKSDTKLVLGNIHNLQKKIKSQTNRLHQIASDVPDAAVKAMDRREDLHAVHHDLTNIENTIRSILALLDYE